jgi:Arc/MetJ-type ribon-helix-helix transcriptional regulator
VGTTLVAVKLTKTEKTALDQLVRDGAYKSVSAALRDGLIRVFEKERIKLDALQEMRLERMKHPMRRGRAAMQSGRRR